MLETRWTVSSFLAPDKTVLGVTDATRISAADVKETIKVATNVDNPSSYPKPSMYEKSHPFEEYNNYFYSLKRELLVIFENNAGAKTIPTNKERSSGIVTLQLTPIQ